MTSVQALQYCLSGVTAGSIYAIVAIGFNIVYNTTGVINFAQGEFLVIGAMAAISLSMFAPLPLAIVLAVVITALLGAALEFAFIRRVRQPTVLRLIIVTIGLSILLREGALHLWDEKVRALPYFSGTEVSSVGILGARISPQVFWVLGVTAVTVAGLSLFFKHTPLGRAMRACAANRTAAHLCGINVRRMVTISFMLSAGIGALAGCVISPIAQTQYDMGAPLAIKGFTVSILGGMGNSMAAVAAGLLLGILEAFSVSVLPLAYQDVVCMIVLLAVLIFRPTGLFPDRAANVLGAR
jgi:branched-chain amino acid transport system permease protein